MKRAFVLSIHVLLCMMLLSTPVFADSIQKRPTPSSKITTLPYYQYDTATVRIGFEIKYQKNKYRKIRIDVADLTEYRAEKAYIWVELERKLANGTFQSVGHFKVNGGTGYHVEFYKEINNKPLIDQAIYRTKLTVKENLNAKMHGRWAMYQVDPIQTSSTPSTSKTNTGDHSNIQQQGTTKPTNTPPIIPVQPNNPEKQEIVLPYSYQLTKPLDMGQAPIPYQLLQPGEIILIEAQDTSMNKLPVNASILVELQRKTTGKWITVNETHIPQGEQAFVHSFKREQDGALQDGEPYRIVLKPLDNENISITGKYNVRVIQGVRDSITKTEKPIQEESNSPVAPTKYAHRYQLTYETDTNNAPYIITGQPLKTLKPSQVIEVETSDMSTQVHLPTNAYIQAALQRRTLFGWKTVGLTKFKKGQSNSKYVFRSERNDTLQDEAVYRVVLTAKNNNNLPMIGKYNVRFIAGQRFQPSAKHTLPNVQPMKSTGQTETRLSR